MKRKLIHSIFVILLFCSCNSSENEEVLNLKVKIISLQEEIQQLEEVKTRLFQEGMEMEAMILNRDKKIEALEMELKKCR